MEPLLSIPKLLAKWRRAEKETGHKPVDISERTLYRLVANGKVPAHGFSTPLLMETEVIEAFKQSRYRNLRLIKNGNPHLGREKEKVAAELERRLKK